MPLFSRTDKPDKALQERAEAYYQTREKILRESQQDMKSWLAYLSGNEAVDRHSAMAIPAFAAGVKLLAFSVANLPLKLYRQNGESREVARDHTLYSLTKRAPNNYQTFYSFTEALTKELIFGNAYVKKSVVRGRVTSLELLPGESITKTVQDSRVVYIQDSDGIKKTFNADEVIHIPNGGNGFIGEDILTEYSDTFRQARVVNSFTTKFFTQGITGNVYFQLPEGSDPLTDEGRAVLDSEMTKNTGEDKFGKPPVFPGDLSVKEFQKLNLKDSQLLELKTFLIDEFARILGLPPHILAELSKSSFSNIYEQNRNILVYSLNHYLKKIESAFNTFLLSEKENETLYFEFSREALLEADPTTKADVMAKQINAGLMTPNEGRQALNRPTFAHGDYHLVPENMSTMERKFGETTPSEKEESESQFMRRELESITVKMIENILPLGNAEVIQNCLLDFTTDLREWHFKEDEKRSDRDGDITLVKGCTHRILAGTQDVSEAVIQLRNAVAFNHFEATGQGIALYSPEGEKTENATITEDGGKKHPPLYPGDSREVVKA